MELGQIIFGRLTPNQEAELQHSGWYREPSTGMILMRGQTISPEQARSINIQSERGQMQQAIWATLTKSQTVPEQRLTGQEAGQFAAGHVPTAKEISERAVEAKNLATYGSVKGEPSPTNIANWSQLPPYIREELLRPSQTSGERVIYDQSGNPVAVDSKFFDKVIPIDEYKRIQENYPQLRYLNPEEMREGFSSVIVMKQRISNWEQLPQYIKEQYIKPKTPTTKAGLYTEPQYKTINKDISVSTTPVRVYINPKTGEPIGDINQYFIEYKLPKPAGKQEAGTME